MQQKDTTSCKSEEAKFQTLFKTSRDGILVTEKSGKISEANNAACEMFGMTETEIINAGRKGMFDINDTGLTLLLETLDKTGTATGQLSLKQKAGNHFPGEITCNSFIDAAGKENTIIIIRDLSETTISKEKARESDDIYAGVFEAIPDSITVSSVLSGKILEVNAGFTNMFGFTMEEALGKTAQELGIISDAQQRTENLSRLQKYRLLKNKEVLLTDKDGNEIVCSATVEVITRNNEECILTLLRDVTESVKAVQNLQQANFRFDMISRAANDALWDWDLENGKLWANKTHQILYGLSDTDDVPSEKVWKEHLHPEDRDSLIALQAANLASDKNIFISEYRFRDANNEYRNIYDRCYIIRNEDGKPIRMIGSMMDITELKRTEKELTLTSQELLTAVTGLNKILDSSLDLICTINVTGEFVNVNAAAEQVLGYKPEELIGRKYTDFVYHEDTALTADEEKNLTGGILIPGFENRYVHKNGKVVHLLWSSKWDKNLQLFFCNAKDITEKKHLELAVQAERNRIFEMFLKAPSAIGMLKGPEHVFEMANPLYLQLTGKKDIVGKTVAEVLPEVIEQGFVEILDNVYRTGIPFIGTDTLVQVDIEGTGELTDYYMDFIYQAYKNEKGETEGVFFFINNITEKILFRKKIEKSERFYKGLIENSADMITLIDESGKNVYASPAVGKKLGYNTAEEFIGLNMFHFLHPDDAAVIRDIVAKLMNHPGRTIQCPVIRNRKKDGSYMWVEGTLTNALKTDGINALISNSRDVTERKEAEETIRNSEEKSKLIMSGALDAIICIDTAGNVTFWNPKAESIFGWSETEVMGRDLGELIIPEAYRIHHYRGIKHYLKTGEGKALNALLELSALKRGGDEFPIELTVLPIKQGVELFFCAFIRDITGRKKAEEENRFKANLLSTIGQAAVATDMNGIVNYWNRAAENIYGWTKDEALGKDIMDLTVSQATAGQGAEIREELRKGATWSGEFKVRKKDGTMFPALITNSPIHDEQNNLSGIIGISSDITEQKKLENLLDKSNRLARVGSWEYNIANEIHYWSPITREIYEVGDDLTPDLQKGISFYKSGASRTAISMAVNNAIKDGTPWDLELQIITAKGHKLWVRDIGEAEFSDGKCVRLYGSFQDITERKKAEIAILKASEEKNRILESIGDGFFAIDKEGTVTYWNNEAENLLGITKESIINKKLSAIYPKSAETLSYQKYLEALKTNQVLKFEDYHGILEKWFEISVYPSLTGLSVFFKDITERKTAEKQLAELNKSLKKQAADLAISNKELEEFAYVASHDLQEPLRMVNAFLGLIEKRYSDKLDNKGRQYISFASDGAKRMRQIILDLLEFSRIGKTEDSKEVINVNELLKEVLVLSQKQIKESRAIVNFENLPSVVSYKTPLRQVFQNLVNNSLKYHVQGTSPVVNISAEESESEWQFAINDNGIGIKSEYFKTIFVIFQRLHNKDQYSGTGIGLAVCKKIIENLGGTIWVESEEGKGSTFYFTIKK